MASRRQVTDAVLRGLGKSPPYAEGKATRDRIELQKLVYLVQECLLHKGMTLGYTFTWYVHGPYSPALARDYFALDSPDDPIQPVELAGEDVASVLRQVRELAGSRPDNLDTADWLELLASLHYYLTRTRRRDAGEDTEIETGFRRHKPKAEFTDNNIGQALDALKQAGLPT